MVSVEDFSQVFPMRVLQPKVLPTGRHWIGKKGGAILRAHKKKILAVVYV